MENKPFYLFYLFEILLSLCETKLVEKKKIIYSTADLSAPVSGGKKEKRNEREPDDDDDGYWKEQKKKFIADFTNVSSVSYRLGVM